MKTYSLPIAIATVVIALNQSNFAQNSSWTPGVNLLYTNPSSTKVGIGTTSPGYPLHVIGRSCIQGNSNGDGGGIWVTQNSSGGANSFIGRGSTFSYESYVGIYSASRWRFMVDDNGTTRFTDKVGIGTGTVPTEQLEVGGNIKCQKIIVNNNWTIEAPDYVFEKSYKLPNLKDVEKQISTEKHLQGVPSAVDMRKNGVDLSELNMALLKKVEEVTLYLIDQNKKIEEQNKKIACLERKIIR